MTLSRRTTRLLSALAEGGSDACCNLGSVEGSASESRAISPTGCFVRTSFQLNWPLFWEAKSALGGVTGHECIVDGAGAPERVFERIKNEEGGEPRT